MVRISNVQKNIHRCIEIIVRLFIFVYQTIISPMLHAFSLSTTGGGCRFYPTCSEYSKQVLTKYGVSLKSLTMVLGRLLRCQPFKFNFYKDKKNSGYDPVK